MFNRETVQKVAIMARESKTYELLTPSTKMRSFLSTKANWSTELYRDLLKQRHDKRKSG